jgi:hypothetical protein
VTIKTFESKMGSGMTTSIANKSAEETLWCPTHKKTQSRETVETMKVGQCLRIIHDDMSCRRVKHSVNGKKDYACSLSAALRVISKKHGKIFESYHEKLDVLVVRRVK